MASRGFLFTFCARSLTCIFVMLAFAAACQAQESVRIERADGAEIPLRVYRPASDQSGGCASIALISPGAGGTERTYTYLADGLRMQGWLAIVMGHVESGPRTLFHYIWRAGIQEGLVEMVTNPALHRDRSMDVTAALGWAEKQCGSQRSGGIHATSQPFIVLLGHSMGSDTVMFEAGAANKLGIQGENRFDAYVAISPSGTGSIFPEHAWSKIRKPMFVLTGTRDKGLEGPWQWRESPYEELPSGCKWLGVIDGATHLNFAGVGFARTTKRLTLDSVGAFLRDARAGNCSKPLAEVGMQLMGK